MKKFTLLEAMNRIVCKEAPAFRSISFDPHCPPGLVIDERGMGSRNIGILGLLALIDEAPNSTDAETERCLEPGSVIAFREWLSMFEYIVTRTVPLADRPDLRAQLALEYQHNEETYRSLDLARPAL